MAFTHDYSKIDKYEHERTCRVKMNFNIFFDSAIILQSFVINIWSDMWTVRERTTAYMHT